MVQAVEQERQIQMMAATEQQMQERDQQMRLREEQAEQQAMDEADEAEMQRGILEKQGIDTSRMSQRQVGVEYGKLVGGLELRKKKGSAEAEEALAEKRSAEAERIAQETQTQQRALEIQGTELFKAEYMREPETPEDLEEARAMAVEENARAAARAKENERVRDAARLGRLDVSMRPTEMRANTAAHEAIRQPKLEEELRNRTAAREKEVDQIIAKRAKRNNIPKEAVRRIKNVIALAEQEDPTALTQLSSLEQGIETDEALVAAYNLIKDAEMSVDPISQIRIHNDVTAKMMEERIEASPEWKQKWVIEKAGCKTTKEFLMKTFPEYYTDDVLRAHGIKIDDDGDPIMAGNQYEKAVENLQEAAMAHQDKISATNPVALKIMAEAKSPGLLTTAEEMRKNIKFLEDYRKDLERSIDINANLVGLHMAALPEEQRAEAGAQYRQQMDAHIWSVISRVDETIDQYKEALKGRDKPLAVRAGKKIVEKVGPLLAAPEQETSGRKPMETEKFGNLGEGGLLGRLIGD
jgi:hypothetical protein